MFDNPDSIKETFVDGKRTVVFIKKIGRYFAELTQIEEDGKIILHKSTFNQKKEPYAKLNDIRRESSSSEGGTSSISHAEKPAPAISLESRGDDIFSDSKDNKSLTDERISSSISSEATSSMTGEESSAQPSGPNGLRTAGVDAEAEVNAEHERSKKKSARHLEWRERSAIR